MQVIKRNGEIAEFDPDKIYQAVLKAAQTVYVLTDDLRQNLAQVTKKVVLDLEEAKVERATISMIQSMVETPLTWSWLHYYCRTLYLLSLATRFGEKWLWRPYRRSSSF